MREPWNSGLGGIGFMVVHPPGATRAEVVDFGPMSPAGLDPDAYKLTGDTASELFTWAQVEDDRNMRGPMSVAIPSAVRGYAMAVERFGRLPWRDLVAPAVALAKTGLPIDWYVTLKTANTADDLRAMTEPARLVAGDLPPICPPNGEPPNLRLGNLPTHWRACGIRAGGFHAGDMAQTTPPISLNGASVGSGPCQLPRTWCRRSTSLSRLAVAGGRGLTAAPTLYIVDRLASKTSAPRMPLFRGADRCLAAGLSRAARRAGRCCRMARAATISAVDRDGGIAAFDDDLVVELRPLSCRRPVS